MEKCVNLFNENAFAVMSRMDDGSVDMLFTDPPYGTTRNRWDIAVDADAFWNEARRIVKPNGAIVIWSQPPFTYKIVYPAFSIFRYEWIIEKTKATGFLNAKKMPLKAHENVLVFYERLPTFYPQKTAGHPPVHAYTKHSSDGTCYGRTKAGISGGGSTERYPRDILKFSWDTQKESLHPTQKPVAACEYFIKTYTDKGDVVFDPFMGSGSIGVAALNLGRYFVGTELDPRIFASAKRRIEKYQEQLARG